MPRKSQHIDAQIGHTDRNLTNGLGRVGMQNDPSCFCQARNLFDWLDRAGLIVGVHDRYKTGVLKKESFKRVEFQATHLVYWRN